MRKMHILALFACLLGLTFSIASAQNQNSPSSPHLVAIKTESFSYHDSLRLAELGVPKYDFHHTHYYEVLWGDHSRNGDSATIYLITEVTGAFWKSGSIRRKGKTIILNVAHQSEGRLAAVAVPTIFEFKLAGLSSSRYKIKFGKFILSSDTPHFVQRRKAQKKPRGFWL